jgi:hypothetical protein
MNPTNRGSLLLSALLGFSASGCLTAVADDEAVDMVDGLESALEGPNALTPNALTPNALTPNALTPNALTPNALTPNALSPSALAAIQAPTQEGALSRQLLKYTVGCALDPVQSFTFSWTDSKKKVHTETYSGILGLAPSWATQPLTGAAQAWVSACLASRVNWYGISVTISSRGSHPGLNKSGSSELTTFGMAEGAFWGNLFSSTPYVFACHYSPNRDYSRSQSRDCAAGHLNPNGSLVECGIVDIAGACESLCQPLTNSGQYYPTCVGPDGMPSSAVITTFLM